MDIISDPPYITRTICTVHALPKKTRDLRFLFTAAGFRIQILTPAICGSGKKIYHPAPNRAHPVSPVLVLDNNSPNGPTKSGSNLTRLILVHRM